MWPSPLLMFGFLAAVGYSTHLSNPGLRVVELRCENQVVPLGLDATRPRLSWILTSPSGTRESFQSAYRILVATRPELLGHQIGDLWDSGKVESANQNNILYSGLALKSGQICYWKVEVWPSVGRPTWSNESHWEMGLLRPEDWLGKWINDGRESPTEDADFYKNDPAPLFRKEFDVRAPIKLARLYLSGLGYSEASLNGKRVGDRVLEPGWTKFDKRVLTSVYDVTHQLEHGRNCLGVRLGNGWYNPLPLKLFGSFDLREHLAVGRPRLLAQLHIEFLDGSVSIIPTDLTWKVGQSGLLRNNTYLGELVDARLEPKSWSKVGFEDQSWMIPAIAQERIGALKAPKQPPIRVTKTWNAVKVTKPSPGVLIYDMGVNYAGWVSLKLNVLAGTHVHLRYGELLNSDGSLNPMTSVAGQIKGNRNGTNESVGGPGAPTIAWQADTYIANGGGETYTPRFTFHAFRYVEITGLPKAIEIKDVVAHRLNSDVESVGSFECSNLLLNQIQEMCVRTFKSNLFSVQSDCPHRERLGYGGDIVATSDAFLANFDMSGFYAKAVEDWSDSALPDGMFTDTAPSMGIQYCGVVWAMAHPLLVDKLYQYYGDRVLNEDEYSAAKKWIGLVEKRYPDGIITDGLSDHESLVPTPSAELVTPMYFKAAKIMVSLASRQSLTADVAHFADLAEKIKHAYQAKFVDASTGKVGPGTQASQAIALGTQILSEENHGKALNYLISDIEKHDGQLTTGILGTRYMLDVLSREGHADIAYRIATRTEFPSWGWMLKNGATTLWEHWEYSDDTFSHNHPMFGSVSQWMLQSLGGIHPGEDAVGFDQIVIAPQTPDGLDWVKSSYRSVRGKIVSNWFRHGKELRFEIEVPVNSVAEIVLPAKTPDSLHESGLPIAIAAGVQRVTSKDSLVHLLVGSGSYHFLMRQ